MKTKLLFVVLAVVVLAGIVKASDVPEMTIRTQRATEVYIDRMFDPADAYAFQFKGPEGWTQCELTQHHTFTVVVRSELYSTFVEAACPRHNNRADDCFCHIFVPDKATAMNYQMLIHRFKQGAPPMSDDRIQYRIK